MYFNDLKDNRQRAGARMLLVRVIGEDSSEEEAAFEQRPAGMPRGAWGDVGDCFGVLSQVRQSGSGGFGPVRGHAMIHYFKSSHGLLYEVTEGEKGQEGRGPMRGLWPCLSRWQQAAPVMLRVEVGKRGRWV